MFEKRRSAQRQEPQTRAEGPGRGSYIHMKFSCTFIPVDREYDNDVEKVFNRLVRKNIGDLGKWGNLGGLSNLDRECTPVVSSSERQNSIGLFMLLWLVLVYSYMYIHI